MRGAEQLVAVRAGYPGAALRDMQAVILLGADRDGARLDPFDPDDAAIILHAETLALDGTPIRSAIAAGHEALAASRRGTRGARPRGDGIRQGYAHELPPPPTHPLCDDLGHRRLWGARDGCWRCAACEPLRFPGEVVATAEAEG